MDWAHCTMVGHVRGSIFLVGLWQALGIKRLQLQQQRISTASFAQTTSQGATNPLDPLPALVTPIVLVAGNLRPFIEIALVALDPGHIVEVTGSAEATASVVHQHAVIEVLLRNSLIHIVCVRPGHILGEITGNEGLQVGVVGRIVGVVAQCVRPVLQEEHGGRIWRGGELVCKVASGGTGCWLLDYTDPMGGERE